MFDTFVYYLIFITTNPKIFPNKNSIDDGNKVLNKQEFKFDFYNFNWEYETCSSFSGINFVIIP